MANREPPYPADPPALTGATALLAKALVDAIARQYGDHEHSTDESARIVQTLATELLEGVMQGDARRLENALRIVEGAPLDQALFHEVGRLTRRLHSSLTAFSRDIGPRVTQIVESDVPDAAAKLHRVIEMTSTAAHDVIEIVERQQQILLEQRLLVEELRETVSKPDCTAERWADAFERLAAVTLRANASLQQSGREIVMAQEFQDLSGQTIRKVIALVGEVESSLVSLVKMFGVPQLEPVPEPECIEEKKGCNQDEVDDLLASLGF